LENEEKIIHFVKEHLRYHQNWFLIFDNVEEFTNIHKYLPNDSDTWGEGKILLTNQDDNLQNNTYINNIVTIEALDPNQKLSLFIKIMNHGSIHPLTVAQAEEA
jgi:hypothetical protein